MSELLCFWPDIIFVDHVDHVRFYMTSSSSSLEIGIKLKNSTNFTHNKQLRYQTQNDVNYSAICLGPIDVISEGQFYKIIIRKKMILLWSFS